MRACGPAHGVDHRQAGVDTDLSASERTQRSQSKGQSPEVGAKPQELDPGEAAAGVIVNATTVVVIGGGVLIRLLDHGEYSDMWVTASACVF